MMCWSLYYCVLNTSPIWINSASNSSHAGFSLQGSVRETTSGLYKWDLVFKSSHKFEFNTKPLQV